MENIKTSIEAMEKELAKIEEELAKDNMPDFSKFILKAWKMLYIKWKEKKLQSFENGDIWFYKYDINCSDKEKITSTLTTLSELKVWDVFIKKDEVVSRRIYDFDVVVWIDKGIIKTHYINNEWFDYLRNYDYNKDNTEVYKINRF